MDTPSRDTSRHTLKRSSAWNWIGVGLTIVGVLTVGGTLGTRPIDNGLLLGSAIATAIGIGVLIGWSRLRRVWALWSAYTTRIGTTSEWAGFTLRKRLVWAVLLTVYMGAIAVGAGALFSSRTSVDGIWGIAWGVVAGFGVFMGFVVVNPAKAWKWGAPAFLAVAFLGSFIG